MLHCISSCIHTVSSHSCCFLLFKEDMFASFSCPWVFLHALCENSYTSLCHLHHYSRQLCKSLYCTYSTRRKAIFLKDDNIFHLQSQVIVFEVSEKAIEEHHYCQSFLCKSELLNILSVLKKSCTDNLNHKE